MMEPFDGIDREQFRSMVASDVRGELGDSQRELLEANPIRWYEALVAMKHDLEAQLLERKTRIAKSERDHRRQGPVGVSEHRAEVAKFEEWRIRTVTFKKYVDLKINEIKPLRNHARDRSYAEQARVRVGYLEGIIDRIEEIADEGEQASCTACKRVIAFLEEALPDASRDDPVETTYVEAVETGTGDG